MLYVILFCTLQLKFSGKIKHIFLYLEFPSVLHKHKNSHFTGNEKFKTLTLLSVVLIQRKGHQDCWNLTKSQNVMKFQWRFLQFLKHHAVAWKKLDQFSSKQKRTVTIWRQMDKFSLIFEVFWPFQKFKIFPFLSWSNTEDSENQELVTSGSNLLPLSPTLKVQSIYVLNQNLIFFTFISCNLSPHINWFLC